MVAYNTPIKKYALEFWEGDRLDPSHISEAYHRVNATFFTHVSYKPNSLEQENASANLMEIDRLLPSNIIKLSDYQALNPGKAQGRIHVVRDPIESANILPDDILILSKPPITLPPVAGIVIETPTTGLSHANLLARGWGIPNVYIKDAVRYFTPRDGDWVELTAVSDHYTIRKLTVAELMRAKAETRKRTGIRTATRVDLSITELRSLKDQTKQSVIAYGTKSSNLGEVISAQLPGITVPPGFTIPYSAYVSFVRTNHLDTIIEQLIANKQMETDMAYRRTELAKIRDSFKTGTFDADLRKRILAKVHSEYADDGLFVRSSSNSEDLPGFSGAGIYTTVPNVRGDDAVIDAIKTVWGSLWNDTAYSARDIAGIDHRSIYMAVLIQHAVKSESSGVMITTDPFDPLNRSGIYLCAKRGLGIKVVEGKKVAEQLIYNPQSHAIRVLTRSDEDSLLALDPNGGIKEIKIIGERAVLTDTMVYRLADAAQRIKRLFGSDQDIEWAVEGGTVYILQARPYVGR